MKDFGLEHNAYVNDLIRDLRNFSGKLHELPQLPPRSRRVAWETMLYLLMENIVEVRPYIYAWSVVKRKQAYSRVKKCNNEGRAQMSLDWQTTHSALLKLSSIKFVPSREIALL